MLNVEIVRRYITEGKQLFFQNILDSVVDNIDFRTNNRNYRSSLIFIQGFCEFYSYGSFFPYHFLPEQLVGD